MRGKITKRTVDALTVDTDREITLRDSELAGFEIRARVGGAKVYGIRLGPAAMRRESAIL